MAQFKAQCIFCDKPARRTAEHIFGQWMRDHFPSAFPDTEHLTSFTDYRTGEPVSSMAKGRMNRKGVSPHGQQLRIVCEPCNNEWMSQLQNRAKEPLISLMRNDWSKLDVQSIQSVAAWLAMVTMCLEFADPKTQAIPLVERQHLMSTGTPPANWIICVGRCRTESAPGTMWHRAAMLMPEGQDFPQSLRPNYQTTTICLEAAFGHVLSGPPALLPNPEAYAALLGVRLFWPPPQIAPSAPLVFASEGMTRVAMQFWRDNGLEMDLLHGARSPFTPPNRLPGQLPQSLVSLLLPERKR